MADKKQRKNIIGTVVACAVVSIFLGCVAFFLFYSKTTTTAAETGSVDYAALICTRNAQADTDLLKTTNPTSVKELISVTYREQKLKEIAFEYRGTYTDKTTATKAENEVHSGVYTFLGSLGLDATYYNSTYSISENSMTMTLSANANELVPAANKLFFLDSSNDLNEMGVTAVKSIYELQGFQCQIEN